MKRTSVAGLGFLAIGLLMNAAPVTAADAKAPVSGVQDPAMAQAMQYMTPGAEHKVLEAFVGKWTAKVTSWMKPGDKPQTSDGTAENTWVLNGHFLKQEFKGNWAGQPFEGVGYTGYDKVRGEYQSSWMDSMGTGMVNGAGPYNAATKTLTTTGEYGCPMTGNKTMWYRAETKAGQDKFTYTSYTKDPSGKEFKQMEIVYTRAK